MAGGVQFDRSLANVLVEMKTPIVFVPSHVLIFKIFFFMSSPKQHGGGGLGPSTSFSSAIRCCTSVSMWNIYYLSFNYFSSMMNNKCHFLTLLKSLSL